jgi:ribosomal protein S18 acetylase RimI-like enzyme
MTDPILSIRPMQASDLQAVVEVHIAGFGASRSTRLGRPFLYKMYEWFARNQPALAHVAVLDGALVGFVTGAVGGSSRKIFRYAWREILLAFFRNPTLLITPGMLESWSSYLRGLFPARQPAPSQPAAGLPVIRAVLASIAVSPAARGRQVGKALVAAFEESARQRGATQLRLGVEIDNPAARHLYESCGWQLVREDPSSNSANYIKLVREPS